MAETPGRTTMDFWQSQSEALRRTLVLVGLFSVAVVLIIIAVYFAVTLTLLFTFDFGSSRSAAGDPPPSLVSQLFHPRLLAAIAGGTILIILGGTVFKINDLRKGGSAVAMLMGGVPVPIDSKDPDDRKLINVVEEMSIASGCPLPSIFVMRRERAINAFAAGYTPTDAAICVSQGAISLLSREELQGVVAHEFSHIVNGDMRLNINLMGVLHGILQIGLLGSVLMYASMGGEHRHRRSSREGGGAAVQLLVLGAVLFAIGYIGVFFAKIIKAAVSRQREFLADAAAVQYTRYPQGLAGALKKIGGLDRGSRLDASHVEEASHFFFHDALSGSLLGNMGGVLSTHPPLTMRIRRIEPSFDGDYPSVEGLGEIPLIDQITPSDKGKIKPPEVKPLPGRFQTVKPGQAGPVPPPVAAIPKEFAITGAAILANVGNPSPEQLGYARELLSAIPESLREECRQAVTARAIVFAILVLRSGGNAQSLSPGIPLELHEDVARLAEEIAPLKKETHLPLVELSLGALRQLSADDAPAFLRALKTFIREDKRVTLLEFCVESMVSRQIDPVRRLRGNRGVQYYAVQGLKKEVSVLLSALAQCGAPSRRSADEAFRAGLAEFGKRAEGMELLPGPDCTPDGIDAAFDHVAQASPFVKKQILKACVAVVNADEKLTIEEAELLQAISNNLDCPMPPLAARPVGQSGS